MMYEIVLDTSVLVAGLRSTKGASHQVLRRVATSELVPLVSTPLFVEYESVLKRPEHQLASGLSLVDIDQFLAAFAAASKPVDIHFMWRPQLRDALDEMVLECIVNSGQELLITHNVKDLYTVAEQFNIRVLTPGQLLKEIIE